MEIEVERVGVFLPCGWWHSTKMNELSMSVAESTLDSANWEIRYKWFANKFRKEGKSELKVRAFEAYMATLGVFV